VGQPYVGEIRMFAGTFAPVGWEWCNGQQIPISENEVLFQLIGTTYGGDGEQTFNLPNLQSRVPIHMQVNTYQLGQMAGAEQVTLTTQQIPVHTHAWLASEGAASALVPTNNMPAEASKRFYTSNLTFNAPFSGNAVVPAGGSQPHENCQPFLVVGYIISMYGIFPQPT